MNPYLKTGQKNTNPPYDESTINRFNTASSNALGYLENRLNDPIYYQRLQNETKQSNKLGNNVMYDPKTGALDLLNQRKKGLNEVKVIQPNTGIESEVSLLNKMVKDRALGIHTTGKTGRYAPEYQSDGFMGGSMVQPIVAHEKNVIGINPKMLNPEYEKYLENIVLHEGEHSTQTAYPGYTNPFFNVGTYNTENNESYPLYREVSNVTPYATNVVKENIYSDDEYYSDPKEVIASKRQVEHLLENAPEGTFQKQWKYGDDIQDEHFNYFLDSKNNVQSAILKKALLGDKNLEDLNEEEKQDLKNRFSNIMIKIAYNDKNDGVYTARFGTQVKNPYIPQARSGIYIKPENRGKFTKWAQSHDMGVQEAANTVMANKEEYNPSVVKMANFAKNASKWGRNGMETGSKNKDTDPPKTYSWGTGSYVSPTAQVTNTLGSGNKQTLPSVLTTVPISAAEIENRKKAELVAIAKNAEEKQKIKEKELVPGIQQRNVPIDNTYTGVNPFMTSFGNATERTLDEELKRKKLFESYSKNTLQALNDVVGNVGAGLLYSTGEAFTAPFSAATEGFNYISGKPYNFQDAVPNATRIALNASGQREDLNNYTYSDGSKMGQQKTMTELLGIDRKDNPTGALITDVFTPTLPFSAIGKAFTGANKIKNIPKTLTSSSKESSGLNAIGNVYEDVYGNKINPEEVSSFIEKNGLKIIEEGIDSPEGRRRLTNQFKKANPKLSNNEINDLIETRIAESKAAVYHSRPKYFVEELQNRPGINLGLEFDDTFPLNNAHWVPYNPSYPKPVQMTGQNPNNNIINLTKRPNPFLNQDFQPGSITLGRGYQDDWATLDHELGHALQKGGQMPIDRKLMELLRPKNIFDEGFQWLNNKIFPSTKGDYNYFSKAGGRRWKNEAYPFLRETRRSMIDKGILKDTYDKVTPLKLMQHYFSDEPGRLLSFTPLWKFPALSKIFNEAPAVVPAAIGTGAAATGVNQLMQQPIQEYKSGGQVDPVDPEEEEKNRLMQERLMRYILRGNRENKSMLDVRGPNEYGISLGDRLNIQSGLSFNPMTGMPSGYGKLGINTNGFNLGVEKKKGLGTNTSTYNLGYNSPKFNIDASYSNENNMPSFRGNVGYNNNGVNVGIGGNYSPFEKGISANIGYNKNGVNAGLNYDYSGQHSFSGNIGYGNDEYNVGLSGNIMPGDSNISLNASYNLGARKPQKKEPIAIAYNDPVEINLIKEEDDTDTDAEQAVEPPKMNYGGYVNPDDPTLPSATTNLFTNYDMSYKSPFVDDMNAAMNGMMKARMAIDSEIGMNPAAKRMTSLYPKEYKFTGDEMFYDEKVNVPAGATGTHYTTGEGNVMFPIIQEGQDGNLFFNRYASPTDKEAMRFETPKEASYFGENYKNIAPMMYNQQEYSKGGDTGLSTVEIERSERVYTPDGELIMETPADAPTHEEGGVKVTLPAGSLVFPKKYYKALDSANGLLDFKKIAKVMLDNAEKAYLSGEPYSSGGKRE